MKKSNMSIGIGMYEILHNFSSFTELTKMTNFI